MLGSKDLGRRPRSLGKRSEEGAEAVQVAFGIVCAVILASAILALQGALNTMGGKALEAIDSRYAPLAVIDPGLEVSEPGGSEVPDDGEDEVIPTEPDEGEGGGSGSGESGPEDEEGELPEVEDGDIGEGIFDTDI